MKHIHHIIPRHAGGSDDPGNLIELTIEEHAEAHRLLFEQYNREEDRLAWLGLSGQVGKEEIILEAIRIGARKSGRNNVTSGHLLSIASMGGKVGGKVAVETGQLASVQPLAAKAGGKQAAESGRLASYNKDREVKFILVHPCGREEVCEGFKPTARKYGLEPTALYKRFHEKVKADYKGYQVKRIQQENNELLLT